MIKTRDRIRFIKKELFRYRQESNVFLVDMKMENLSPRTRLLLEKEAQQVLIRASELPLQVRSDHHVREILSALAFSQSSVALPESEEVW